MQTPFFVRSCGRFLALPLNDVLYVTAKGNYCEVHTTGKKKFLVYISLTCLERHMPEHLFCRTHRSHLISIRNIDWFDYNSVSVAGEEFPLSKTGFDAVSKKVFILSHETGEKEIHQLGEVSLEEHLGKRAMQKKAG
jgi:DNA-binding LytR/AlgR family response regulator